MRSKAIVLLLLITLLGACGRSPQVAATPEKETHKKTVWTARTELFMEYDKPQPGQKAGFLIHLTRLSDFKPLAEGTLTLTFIGAKGEPVTTTVNRPERPGIFKAAVLFKEPGPYTLRVLCNGNSFSDEITVEDIQVAAGSEKHPEESQDGKDGAVISFLKEQQWTVDFQTGLPLNQALSSSLTVAGEIIPVANGEATVSTPVAGILSLAQKLPYLGQRVNKNEVLAVISPPVSQPGGVGQLTASYAEAKNRVVAAQREYERALRLVEAKAVPKRRLEEAELALANARAALAPLDRTMQGLNPGTSGDQVTVRAPFSGTVVELLTGNGKAIEAGQPLLRIINTSSVWLKANVPASEIGGLKRREQATFTVSGIDGPLRPSRFIAVSDVVDPKSRTVPVLFEVANAGGQLKIGMFAEVAINNGHLDRTMTIPEEALFEDEGRFFVFIQPEGESFVRREVKTGIRGAGRVQIVSGLKNDERVVFRGGYYVKLASLSSRQPDAHAGHAH
jgi:RND family efflux transporter MFP subunit